MVRTLIGNGFVVDNVSRRPTYALFACHRFDEFGVSVPYVFALADAPLDDPASAAVARVAAHRKAHALIIGESSLDLPSLAWDSFIARCGGPIKSWLPLEPSFPDTLSALGHNQVLPGVEGKADDLFEEYAQVALQFVLGNRVIRYGQDRRFEPLPDGIAFARDQVILLYDAKAYSAGYPVTKESVRQFSDYVNVFHQKYEHYVGRVYAFVVVSGHFAVGKRAKENQSRAMYEACRVPLVFLTADELGAATALLVQQPAFRTALNWRTVFSGTDITSEAIRTQIESTQKDGLVRI